jgi:cyclophilin family peptidyl-prolyl cis-trans isomerase
VGTAKRERQKANRQARLEQLQKQEKQAKTKKRVIQIAVLVGVFVLAAWLLSRLVSGGGDDEQADTSTTVATTTPTTVTPATTAALPTTVPGKTITGETPCPSPEGASERATQFEQEPPMCIDTAKTYTATMVTNKGELTATLDATKAPKTVNNFVVLARYHYFDNTVCHRIIPSFVVQCGDPTATGSGGPGYEFADELPATGEYQIGSLAMANSGPNTNGSQFFMITGDQGTSLPPNYSLFGQITEGLDTTLPALDAAGNPDQAANGVPPLEQVVIESVTITES